jgi:Acyl-CoA synthetases (AMP-forming)/AMP-acid ligases II
MNAFPPASGWPSLAGFANVAEPFVAAARANPGRVAVICGEQEHSYAEVNAHSNQICALLAARGVRPGDAVAYFLPNGVALIEIYYAIQKLGAVAVPVNARSIAPELEYFLRTSEASVLLFSSRFAEVVAAAQGQLDGLRSVLCVDGAVEGAEDLRPLLDRFSDAEPEPFREPEALTRIQFTGGSTGAPKAAERTHRADLTEFEGVYGSNGMFADEAKVVLIQCPLEHHGGHSWFASALSLGATLVLCSSFDPAQILAGIQRYRVSYIILLPPTTYLRLMSYPQLADYDLSSVRLVQSSAGGTSPEIVADIYRTFPNAVMNYGWGQTESGLGCSVVLTQEMALKRRPQIRSIGKPMPLMEMRVVDEDGRPVPDGVIGEGVCRSAAVMRGYHGQPELTASGFTADGWWRTGDLMMRDADGYFYLAGRKRELIKSGGENVFVGEVEAVVREHPAVLDAMVYGEPDPVLDEAVAAVVELRPGASLTLAELQNFCRGRLAGFKKPRSLTVLPGLDRDFAGKLHRSQVITRSRDTRATLSSLRKSPDLGDVLTKVHAEPDVYRVTMPMLPRHAATTNAYLVAGPDGWLLVDPGAGNELAHGALLRSVEQLGAEITDVYLSHEHADHSGLVARWLGDGRLVRSAAAFGPSRVVERFTAAGFSAEEVGLYAAMQLRAYPADVPELPSIQVGHGQRLTLAGLDARIVATPGHTDGHLCLYLPDSQLLFSGDHVLFDLPPGLFGESGDPVASYFDSLSRVADLDVETVLPGHGRPRGRQELDTRLRRLRRHHERRLNELVALVADSRPLTAAELIIPLRAPLRDWAAIAPGRRWSIASTVVARLEHLVATGQLATTLGPDGLIRYHVESN